MLCPVHNCKGGDSMRLLQVVVHHVVLPKSDKAPYERKSDGQPRCEVLILSDSYSNDSSLSLSARLVIRAISSTEGNLVVYRALG